MKFSNYATIIGANPPQILVGGGFQGHNTNTYADTHLATL